ncbi:MAG: S-adenosylmethionine:tRNA ribosyltransferase-isomerase [Deltaproteobacteria bacterium ADurb.Bin510]|nr:MAG: S-adenosylmethionine:tRNA ribosyltransferase-isomerase [Deltaproteobacteria bacterium ADurb.Bin510]
MEVAGFEYALPEDLIAQYPLERGSERLLVLERASGQLSHRRFGDLVDYFRPGDLLVMNDTRVMPARLHGFKSSGGRVEVFLLKRQPDDSWQCLIRASKAPKPGALISFSQGLEALVRERLSDSYIVEFNRPELLPEVAQVPLPPYIKRSPEALDAAAYQTVYARCEGSVAAPTAGLHFTPQLLAALAASGVELAFVTLHVGAGTFKPVQVARVEDHVMHFEDFSVSAEAAAAINRALEERRRVITVGTTSTRVLEHLMRAHGRIVAGSGSTDLFIYPGQSFGCISGLITNFHLPCSTLLMLVSAFGGHASVMQAYRAAVNERYRFFSYGDAMLIV